MNNHLHGILKRGRRPPIRPTNFIQPHIFLLLLIRTQVPFLNDAMGGLGVKHVVQLDLELLEEAFGVARAVVHHLLFWGIC